MAYSKGGNLRDRLGLFNILGICDTSEQSRGGCDGVELHCEIPIPAGSSESGGKRRRRREGSSANRAVPALKENESKIPREIELKKERRGKINGKKCTVEEGWGSS